MLESQKYEPKIGHYLTYLSHLALVSYNQVCSFLPLNTQNVERMNTDTECCISSEEALAGSEDTCRFNTFLLF